MSSNDDRDPLDEIRRRLEQPLTEEEIERDQITIAFASMTDPGHWCAACGQEQPGPPSCGECYDVKRYVLSADEIAERQAVVALMTPRDLADLSWLWRS